MPTLYQILKDKLSGKPAPKLTVPDLQIYNPIGAKRGVCITVDDLDFRGKNFFVKALQEFAIELGGKTFKFTDYTLQANLLSGETIDVHLRVCPEPNGKFGLPFRAMVLSLYDSLEYNEGLHNVVKDITKKFIVDNPQQELHEEYWRVNDVGIAYLAAVSTLGGGNDEFIKSSLEYWDYSRMTKVDNVEVEQFLFVQMNKDRFEIWRGYEINPEQVIAL